MLDSPAASADAAPAAAMAPINLELRWQSVCLLVLTVLAIGGALYVLRPVLVPFVLAVAFTVGLSPLLDLIERRLGSSRLVSVTIAFLLGLALLTLLGTTIAASVASLQDNQDYQHSARDLVAKAAGVAVSWGFMPAAEPAAFSEPPTGGDGAQAEPSATAGPPSDAARLGGFLAECACALQGWLLNEMLNLFSTLGVVLIFMFFLLLGAGGGTRPTEGMWPVIETKLREYIVLKTVISVFTGFAVWLVLALFGVPLALVLGLLTFLFNYIPNFGPIVTALAPVPLILLHPELGVLGKTAAIGLSSGVQFVSGNVVEPQVMGDSFELHPIVILLALMLWGMIWGFVGMLLAVPITAAIKILLERINRTRPIALVMGGDLSAIQFGETEVA